MLKSDYKVIGKKILIIIMGIIAFVTLCFVLLFGYVRWFEMPDSDELLHPRIKEASTLLDTKGRMIGIYINEYRNVIETKDINPYIKTCVIAVEDTRFYNHNGVDFRALGRVLIKSMLFGDKDSGGGSTITQQLAKQFYPRPRIDRNKKWLYGFYLLKSKIKEWLIAWKLENLYSKDEILTMYLNKFEFVNGAYGIDAAAVTYFSKHQNELSLSESATLIGMLKNPSLYNPVRFPEQVLKRRNEVLDKVNPPDVEKEKAQLTDFSKFKRFTTSDTIVPYFKSSLESYLNRLIKEENLVKNDGSYYNIFSDGLTIESTIDLDLQKYAEEATKEHMAWIQGWFDKDWTKDKPWLYMANEKEKSIRMAVIEQRAKMSPRYVSLRKKILIPVLNKAGVDLTDGDIYTLISGEKDESIKKSLRKDLTKLLHSAKFIRIKNAFRDLEMAYRKEFNTKIEMNIFDFKNGMKKVEMTPMDSIKYHLSLLQTAMVAIDPHDGYVKCWNGGLDYNYFNLDHVNIRRSIGSTAKPFLYTLAMSEKGIQPCDEFKDTIYTIMPGEGDFKNKEPWSPENATKINTNLMYNLYHGLMYSKNTISVRLLKELGSVQPLIALWDKIGIKRDDTLPNGRLAVPNLPAIALGAVDITLLQLTSAFTTFANEGQWVKPVLIKTIKNKNGEVIYRATSQPDRAIEPLHNAIMLDMLVNNESHDFSMHLQSQNGGKTGTTDDQSDGWYIGLTPNLVVGIWTGGDEKWIRFLRDDVGQGFFTARPVFEKFIRKLEQDKSEVYDIKAQFAKPPIGFEKMTNCSKRKTESIPETDRTRKPIHNPE